LPSRWEARVPSSASRPTGRSCFTRWNIALGSILEQSPTPPVILLQADHGPGSRLDWESPEGSDLRERFSILNAYRLPAAEQGALYASISPVNSFRVVFNTYFGARLQLLPDQSYFAYWDRPYDFLEIAP
jgi:hypothetical protein